jgi:hypothetical protein
MITQPSNAPRPSRVDAAQVAANPWLLWNVETSRDREILSVAELAECRCPDLCDRDHANE